MNTKTIEEKARAYDKAVINGSRLWECDKITREDYEYIFPALKESEDERIRENIIATIHLYYGEPLEDEAKEMIAWLESRCQAFTKKDVDYAYLKGVCDAKHEIEKQGEQKKKQYQIYESTKDRFYKEGVEDGILIGIKKQDPIWSEEDKDYYDAIIAKLEVTQEDAALTDNQMNFLKSLRERYTWKPSDEQMNNK